MFEYFESKFVFYVKYTTKKQQYIIHIIKLIEP